MLFFKVNFYSFFAQKTALCIQKVNFLFWIHIFDLGNYVKRELGKYYIKSQLFVLFLHNFSNVHSLFLTLFFCP